MKTSIALLLLFVCATAFPKEEKAGAAFLDFKPDIKPFSQADAERLASEQFQRRFGACGMVIFKGRKFEAWIFETRIGYAGSKGPDIVVFSSFPSSVAEMAQSLAKIDPRLSLVPKQP